MRNLDVYQQVLAFHFNGVVIQTMTVPMLQMRPIVIEIQLAIRGCLAAEMENAFTRHGHGNIFTWLQILKFFKFILLQRW